jgi:flagellar hook-basal body complex protein FliE
MALELARPVGGSGIAKATGKVAAAAGASPAASFADSLNKLVDSVEQTEADANSAVVDMVDGKTEVHDAMIALQRAEMSLQLTIQIRNKLVQAYQDIQRMPI